MSQEDPRGFTAKVSDFGLSQLQPDKTPSTGATPAAAAEPAGTVAYMAPEMLCYGSCFRACDVYAFGILGTFAKSQSPAGKCSYEWYDALSSRLSTVPYMAPERRATAAAPAHTMSTPLGSRLCALACSLAGSQSGLGCLPVACHAWYCGNKMIIDGRAASIASSIYAAAAAPLCDASTFAVSALQLAV